MVQLVWVGWLLFCLWDFCLLLRTVEDGRWHWFHSFRYVHLHCVEQIPSNLNSPYGWIPGDVRVRELFNVSHDPRGKPLQLISRVHFPTLVVTGTGGSRGARGGSKHDELLLSVRRALEWTEEDRRPGGSRGEVKSHREDKKKEKLRRRDVRGKTGGERRTETDRQTEERCWLTPQHEGTPCTLPTLFFICRPFSSAQTHLRATLIGHNDRQGK